MKLYRIEHKDKLDGMWTVKINGKLVLDYLSDTRLSKIPMPHDDVFRTSDKVWKTSVSDIKSLYDWFSHKDMVEMMDYGFKLMEIESTDIIIQPSQVLFMYESIIEKVDITDRFLLESNIRIPLKERKTNEKIYN